MLLPGSDAFLAKASFSSFVYQFLFPMVGPKVSLWPYSRDPAHYCTYCMHTYYYSTPLWCTGSCTCSLCI